jgi:hypothetical protein
MPKTPSSGSKTTSKPKKDYEQLGKTVAAIYETGYIDAGKSMRMSFFKGLLGGLGGVIGATVGVALLLWVLSWFGQVPLIGEFVQKVEYTIESYQ